MEIKRDWNVLSLNGDMRTLYLSCAVGSSVDAFESKAEWLNQIGKDLTFQKPSIVTVGIYGQDTVSDPSCVVE